MSNHRPVEIIGYRPHNSVMSPEVLECYGDYKCGRLMAMEQFHADLHAGILPPGLLVRIDRGKLGVVTGVFSKQRIEVI